VDIFMKLGVLWEHRRDRNTSGVTTKKRHTSPDPDLWLAMDHFHHPSHDDVCIVLFEVAMLPFYLQFIPREFQPRRSTSSSF
jgi:hypothetical protein